MTNTSEKNCNVYNVGTQLFSIYLEKGTDSYDETEQGNVMETGRITISKILVLVPVFIAVHNVGVVASGAAVALA